MPIYVYEPILSEGKTSKECCHFESLESLRETPQTQCPTCGHPIRRAITGFSLGGSTPSSAPMFSKSTDSDSSASRTAKMAMRHQCGVGCKH